MRLRGGALRFRFGADRYFVRTTMPAGLSLRLAVLGLCASLLGGCTYTAAGTSPGAVTIHRPGTIPPLAQASPPAATAAAPRSGRYAGIGTLIANPGARSGCRATVTITNFVVSGNQVVFGGFRGVIDPGGQLDMQAGHRFVSGRFVGERFEGRWWQPPPACAYWLRLDPIT